MNSPNFSLVIQRKAPDPKPGHKNPNPFIQVGAAWLNDNGSITLRINDGVVLDWRMAETHHIRLFKSTKTKNEDTGDDVTLLE